MKFLPFIAAFALVLPACTGIGGVRTQPVEYVAGRTSKFDGILKGNLIRLAEGEGTAKAVPETKPTKYFVFYHSASWCPGCREFTPQLVDFYKKQKNPKFEVILISADESPRDMEKYAAKTGMPWPMLRQEKVAEFDRRHDQGVRTIPSVITCDLQGNIVSRSESIPALAQLLK